VPIRMSPAARRRAKQLSIEWATLSGSGPGGAIVLADVERAQALIAERDQATAAVPQVSPMRSAIAAAMAKSKREIPHYYLGTTIDITKAQDWLGKSNAARPITERVLTAVLLLKGVALALRETPELNGTYEDGQFRPANAVHIGWAVSMRSGGLIAPAIHDVDKLSLDDVMAKLRDLVKRVRSGGLKSSELIDSTITVTSLGDRGAEEVYGVVYPPQVALVGFGSPVQRPWVIDGNVSPRLVVRTTLAADHRASDGHRGSLFLMALDRILQEPDKI
jgi:pyruvate dehydrogenase E2 component (dihydrolipoamide acetyltransferase)